MKKLIRYLALVMVLVIGISGSVNAFFENETTPYSNAYIKSVVASVTSSGTTVYVSFTVYGTGVMTSIGASCVRLYTSDGSLVKTFWSSSNSSMLGTDRGSYTGSVSYDGTKGTTYYAVVTAYAKNSTGNGTAKYTTGTVTL